MNTVTPTPVVEERRVNEVESVRQLAIRFITKRDALKEEIKTKTDAFNELLREDSELAQLLDNQEELAKKIKLKKEQALTRPEVAEAQAELKDLRAERKECTDSISDYLFEVERMEQLTLFDIEVNGVKRKITKVANVK